ncbi:MAG: hypothetical protein WCA82_09615 [Jiangellales bacterium]
MARIVHLLVVPGTTIRFLLLGTTLIRHRRPRTVPPAPDPDPTPA